MMNIISAKEVLRSTPKGCVQVRSFCAPEEIRRYTLDGQFNTYAHYKSLFTKRESLEKMAEGADANIVLALVDGNHIIGFGVLAYPDPNERWCGLGPQIMMEVKAIEVARNWREARIASAILKMVIDHPRIEDKIAYMVGYSWTWDLEGTHKTPQEYRDVLVRLFGRQGFQVYPTNEPNVCLKPENLFMCRVGATISETILNRFKWLRFGLSPWTWTQAT